MAFRSWACCCWNGALTYAGCISRAKNPPCALTQLCLQINIFKLRTNNNGKPFDWKSVSWENIDCKKNSPCKIWGVYPPPIEKMAREKNYEPPSLDWERPPAVGRSENGFFLKKRPKMGHFWTILANLENHNQFSPFFTIRSQICHFVWLANTPHNFFRNLWLEMKMRKGGSSGEKNYRSFWEVLGKNVSPFPNSSMTKQTLLNFFLNEEEMTRIKNETFEVQSWQGARLWWQRW